MNAQRKNNGYSIYYQNGLTVFLQVILALLIIVSFPNLIDAQTCTEEICNNGIDDDGDPSTPDDCGGMPVPFNCPGTFYQFADGRVYELSPAVPPNPLAPDYSNCISTSTNAAYNPQDNFIYAWTNIVGGGFRLYRVDSNGRYFLLPPITGDVPAGSSNLATFDNSGTLYLASGDMDIVFIVNISTMVSTSVPVNIPENNIPGCMGGGMSDWVFFNGNFYGTDGFDLVTIDNTWTTTETPLTNTIPGCSAYGAVWIVFDGTNAFLYAVRNNTGDVYMINISTGSTMLSGIAGVNTSDTDGANCPPDPPCTNFSLSAIVTDASCPDAADGKIDLTVNNAIGNLTYSWTTSGTGSGLDLGAEDQCGLTVGTYSVVVTDDAFNCVASLSETVGVETGGDPFVISCPPDSNIECDEDPSPNGTGVATGTINCVDDPNIIITFNDVSTQGASGCAQYRYTITRTWTATAASGETRTCVQTVNVDDTTPPLITCPVDLTLDCNQSTDPNDTGIAIAADNCSTADEITIVSNDVSTQGPIACNQYRYTITRTWTATDICGNSSSCVQIITVDDTTPPVITCPGDLTLECDQSTDPTDTGIAIAVDNCSTSDEITIVSNDVSTQGPNSCAQFQYTITRTWTATDICGNSSSCMQIITVEDSNAPEINCPGDLTFECDETIDLTNTGTVTITDNCTMTDDITLDSSLVSTQGPSGCSLYQYTITKTWTATDACGNSNTCSQVITVEDTTSPSFTLPLDVTIECGENPDDLMLTGDVTNVLDNCDTNPDTTYTDADNFTLCNGGTIDRTWTITDACGNDSMQVQTITINPPAGPGITCPPDEVVECLADIVLNPDDAVVVTDCNLGFTTIITGPVQVGPSDCPGTTYTFTYTVTDDCGRTAACDQVFTIDNIGPMIICPPDEVVTCEEDIDADPNNLTVVTSCGLSYFAYVKLPLIVGQPGCDGTVYTYLYKVVDECGRLAQCEQQFLIQNSAPVVTVPPGETLECFEDITVSIADVTVTTDCPNDAVSINVLGPEIDGPIDCPGTTYTYTYRVKDQCNRIVEVQRVFTNGPNDEPTIEAPADITCECLAGVNTNPDHAIVTTACGNSVDYEVVTSGPVINGTLDCPGTTYTYTYTITDACGRTASDQQVFTVLNEGPVLNCPANCVILDCDEGNYTAIIDAWLASVTATASCGGNVLVSNDFNGVNGFCINNGFTPVNFLATDYCGRTTSCTGMIIIADTDAPVIYVQPEEVLVPCNGLTQNIFDNWISTQGGAEAIDDCWGMNISWSTIPPNPMLNCAGGPQAIIVDFIATDGCGNASSVTGIFNTKVQPEMVNISGQINREDYEPVANVQIEISGGTAGVPDMDYTENSGAYGFPELEYEDDLLLKPEKNDDPLNGISTHDLILLQKHILEVDPLDSPYKRIAADVNRSGHITTVDAVHLRKLILFIDEAFQENTSWRFVDANFVFPNPEHPFESPFPEVFTPGGLAEETADFIGIKIGDLNLSSTANGFMEEADDRSGLDDLIFEVKDQSLKSDQQYRIDFTAQNFEQINGFQFTLNFDQAAIEAISIEGADLSHFNENNYGMTKADNGAITVSWNHDAVQNLRKDEVAFSLIATANSDVQLSDVISITSEYTRAEAYQSNELMNVDLAFNNNGTIVQTEAFRLFQNQPNPFKEATMVGFNLPKAGVVNLTIYDVSGQLVYSREGSFAKGYNQIDLDRADLPSGVLFYHLETTTSSDTKKMILL